MAGLIKSNEHGGILQMIMDNSKEVIWAVDTSYHLLFANPAFFEALKIDGEEDIKTGDNVLNAGYPEDLIEFWGKNYQRGFQGESFEIFSLSPRMDGTHYFENAFSPLTDDSGQQLGVFVISRDVTEKMKAEMNLIKNEEKFRNYFEHAPIGIFVADKNGNYIQVNEHSSEISGYSKDELLKMNISDLVLPAEAEDVKAFFKSSIVKGSLISERKILGKDRSLRYWSIKAVRTDDSNFIGFVNDITAQKLAEEALLKNETLLKQSNDAKDNLLSIIAHDLKNPFGTLLGYADLLYENLRSYDTHKIESQVNIIRKTLHHTYDMLEDMLLWSQSQRGKLPYEPERVMIGDICKDVLEIMSDLAEAKNIQLKYFEPQQIEVMADVNMLKSILRNLISNAIKFSYKKGKVKIYTELNGPEAIIVVSDNGTGISSDSQENLFTPLHPKANSGTANERGTGFGLQLCMEFVRKHGGRIWVESTPGKGSDFKFTLPVYKG